MLQIMKNAVIAMLCVSLLALYLMGCDATAANGEASPRTETSTPTEAQERPSAQETNGSSQSGKQTEGKKASGKQSKKQAADGQKAPAEKDSSTQAHSNGSKKTKPASGTKPSGSKSSDSPSSGKKSKNETSQKSKKSGGKSQNTSAAVAAKALTDGEIITGGTYTATGDDESALAASGTVKAAVTGASIVKSAGSASSADGASFTGVNAAVRVYDSAELTLTDCTVEASAPNATGVFAYDKGVVTLDNCTVTVTGGGAGGVQVAGGGTLYGTNLTVTSASKAAIRSDRGGGIMLLDGGVYTSTGSNGCPAIYSTADITVKNAACVSTNSRAVIIEGKNTVTLENCTLSGNDQSTKAGSVKANVLLYQSASGDAGVGTSVFSMTGGSMITKSGAMFYCTNTASVINLENAELILSDEGTLLIVSAGRWGKDGKNGGDCVLNAKSQTLTGKITVDGISSLTMNLTDGSSLTGAITGEGRIAVTLDASSSWTLTGDSYVTSLEGDLSGLILNGFTLYVNGVPYAA